MFAIHRDLPRQLLIACAMFLAVRTAQAGTERPIMLETPTGSIFGTLTLPELETKLPVVLLIAGSGPTDRDGNALGTPVHPDTLKLLSAALADAGFASVRYDKRGIAASAGAMSSEADLRIDTYADDAALWATKLAGDARFSSVVIVGHSEGSLIGMLAAGRGRVHAFVSLEGPAGNAANLLRTQLRGKLPPELASRSEAILTALQQGQRVEDVPPALNALYRPSVQPYLISWFGYVPSELFARLAMPCLIVQGTLDIQVAAPEADALHAAKPASELLIVPGMTHVMKLATAGTEGQKATYLDPTLPLAPAFTHGLITFLSRTVKPISIDPTPNSRP